MSALTEFQAHCRKMAEALHKPECRKWVETGVRAWAHWETPNPECLGCNHPEDRRLFAQMAEEVDDYLAPQVDLFGELTNVPPQVAAGDEAVEA